jgi:integrase
LELDVFIPALDYDSDASVSINDSRLNKDFVDLCAIVFNVLSKISLNDAYPVDSVNDDSDKRTIIKQYKDGLPNPKLSELWDAYYKDKTSRNQWQSGTGTRYTECYTKVIEIIGDLELDHISSNSVQKLIDGLRKYPKNKNKYKQFKDKPFSKAMANMPGFEPLDLSSINYIIITMSGLFKFALEDRRLWKIDHNPFFRKQIKVELLEEDDKGKRAFTKDEFIRIITELSKVKRYVNPEKFWVPLICFYSGMRLNEACQLRLKDIEYVDNVPVFRLRHIPSLNLKTKNKKNRTVPIHKTLQTLGLLKYALRQKEHKAERLFPKLNVNKDGKWRRRIEAWFNRTVKHNHLKLGKDVSFHSTKHTFINWYKQNINMTNSEMSMLKTISAHFDDIELTNKFVDGGITLKVYGEDYNVPKLYEFINLLDYGVDLSILEPDNKMGF